MPFRRAALALAALSPWIAVQAPSKAISPPDTVCGRLALALNMQPAPVPDPPNTWALNMVTLGMALFGGGYSLSLAVYPVDDTVSVRDATAFTEKACKQAKRDVTCTVEGPAKLKIHAKKASAEVVARATERAVVVMDMRRNRLTCQDLTAGTA